MFAYALEMLAHEALFPSGEPGQTIDEADALLIEPGDTDALAAAELLRRRRDIPIICASIYAPLARAEELRPVAYLAKPFAIDELRRASLHAARA